MKTFQFGIDALEKDYKEVRWTIQHSHQVSSINKSIVLGASSWASSKWGKNMDYRVILGYLGIEITED